MKAIDAPLSEGCKKLLPAASAGAAPIVADKLRLLLRVLALSSQFLSLANYTARSA